VCSELWWDDPLERSLEDATRDLQQKGLDEDKVANRCTIFVTHCKGDPIKNVRRAVHVARMENKLIYSRNLKRRDHFKTPGHNSRIKLKEILK
jgi:hypothetical protein